MQSYGEVAVERMAREGAVVVFSVSTCCMCLAVKRLFCGMGVHPTVYELDRHPRGPDIHRALAGLLLSSSAASASASASASSIASGGNASLLPVVFIGGNLVGPMDSVMASHINGTLVPLLKEAGALWL